MVRSEDILIYHGTQIGDVTKDVCNVWIYDKSDGIAQEGILKVLGKLLYTKLTTLYHLSRMCYNSANLEPESYVRQQNQKG